MRAVTDGDGRACLLLERGAESSLVYDPGADERRRVPTERLDPAGTDPLAVAGSAVPDDAGAPLDGVSRAALGLVVDLADRGPRAVREMLDSYGRCESDLHGLLAECRVAGLVEETTVGGERGYRVSERADGALGGLRSEGRVGE